MNMRIMVVDDSQATRRVVSALVGSRWTVCGSAENGKRSPVSQNDRELLQNFVPKLSRRNLDVFC